MPKAGPDLVPGTLVMLILRVLEPGSMHGYAIALRIRQLSGEVLLVEEGSLYPALQKMLLKGWVSARWGISDTKRRVRFYSLTPAGRKQLTAELAGYSQVNEAIQAILNSHEVFRMIELLRRARYLINRRRLERELSDEMAAHREMMGAENATANPAFGSQLRLMEASREVWGWCWLDRLFQDLHYGLRLLRRSPGFSLTAVLVLALGIGVNLTAFRLLLLETAPNVRDPDSLVEVDRWFPNGMGTTIAYPVLAFYAEHARSFAAVIGAHEDSVAYGGTTSERRTPGSAPDNVTVNFVTATYFAEQSPPLSQGRGLATVDEEPAAEPAAVVSQRFWERRLGSNPDVVGESLRLNGKPVRVAGVLLNPREHRIDVWMTLSKQPYVVGGSNLLTDWTSPSYARHRAAQTRGERAGSRGREPCAGGRATRRTP